MKKFLILLLMLAISTFNIASAEMVIYNTNTGKFHKITCKWAKKCTVNCIKIEKAQAIKRGGIPCKVCGG